SPKCWLAWARNPSSSERFQYQSVVWLELFFPPPHPASIKPAAPPPRAVRKLRRVVSRLTFGSFLAGGGRQPPHVTHSISWRVSATNLLGPITVPKRAAAH